jgi:hypothetical protein
MRKAGNTALLQRNACHSSSWNNIAVPWRMQALPTIT